MSIVICLMSCLAACIILHPPRLGTSLYGLIGEEAERIPKFVRDQSAREVSVIVSSANRKSAEEVAESLRRQYGEVSSIPEGALDFIRRERAGLVSPEAAKLLTTPEGRAKIARRAIRQLYTMPTPPVLGWADDPFCLTDGFLSTLSMGRNILETNGVTHVLVRLNNLPNVAACMESGTTIRMCGAPVHAARASEQCKREINILTAFSLVFIALLSVFVFHSVRWLPILSCSLLVSALSGGIALCLLFSEIHLMALVFGTTVLGLVIDYSFHWLLSDLSRLPITRRNLLLSFLTTEISLSPLVFATVPVLRQSAVFLGAGLAAALLFVVVVYPRSAGGISSAASLQGFSPPRIGARLVCTLLALLALVGLVRLEVKTDVTSVYRSPSDLLESERLRASFGTFDFSIMPSLSERHRLAGLVELLYAEQSEALRWEGGLDELVPPPAPTFDFVSPQTLLNDILTEWTHETLVRLGLALFVMFAVLAFFLRSRAARIFAPSAFALVTVAGLLSLGGVRLNLFHLLAGFLLAGMGIDYTVFLHSGEKTAFRSVLCSLLTSVAGFGALVFVSMPVAASFGEVLGLGLPISFLCAVALIPRGANEVECAASPIGLEILLLIYRLLGLHALHAMSVVVGTLIWLCSSSVRRVSSSLHNVLFFTRSLADKMVVMSGGSAVPGIEVDESEDVGSFVEDVQKRRGVFILSSHVGTVEMLATFGVCDSVFHAWMDFNRTSVFTEFYMKHACHPRVVIHPISTFDMGSVFEMGTLLDEGNCVLMAGDRGDGAFRLAASLGHPVYFIACLYVGHCRYRIFVRRLPDSSKDMKQAFESSLQSLSASYPAQRYAFA